ncbi:MAG TPA: Mov34/MPN/PAD-1 family protein [Candidatus Nanoarchaeia archaeon]|nr:Mov34/MPN/PAD-1 family protein [Candidatus Nanoarchaeia archaeon]
MLGLLKRGIEKEIANFDPYDSSHKWYSEAYGRMEGHLRSRYQFRFRERIERQLPSPEEPLEYRVAAAAYGQQVKQFFKADGSFDVEEYLRSDLRGEALRLSEAKLHRKIARDINWRIDREFAQSAANIRISRYSLDKSEYIARRVSELTSHAGKNRHYEIGMLMLDDAGREDGITIRDVIIGHEQIVQPLHCDITPLGTKGSFDETKKDNEQIVGWCHSHANIETFFSSEDDDTMADLSAMWGITRTISASGQLADRAKFSFFYGLTVNEKGEEPAARVMGYKPRAYVEEGQIRYKREAIDLERTPYEDLNYENKWPMPIIVDDGKALEIGEVVQIDRKIIERIMFADSTRLSDYYLDHGNFKLDLPHYSGASGQQLKEIVDNVLTPLFKNSLSLIN